ncbi:MAG: YkgJ family cysteine cluster protein [Candidatus Aureabacteria bacterium]|nr:YkgJ family cysteine cluster protein [Candidatus Auribacterota bacterium]
MYVETAKLFIIIVITVVTLYLLLKREIECIRLGKKDFKCRKCGVCCSFLIFLNRADIERILKLGYKEKDFSKKILWFNILRKKDDACVFAKEEGTYNGNKGSERAKEIVCKIYENRPQTCRKYPSLRFFGIKANDNRCRSFNE